MENLVLDEKEPQAEEEEFCLLAQLTKVPDIAYIVISMLDFVDLFIVGHVSKKWHKFVVNAPKCVKLSLTVDKLRLRPKTARFTQINSNSPYYMWFMPMDQVFDMIRRVKTTEFEVYFINKEESPERYFNDLIELFKFLLNHRNDICSDSDWINFFYPTFAKIDYSVLSRVFSQFRSFSIFDRDAWEIPPLWHQEMKQVILEYLVLKTFYCYVTLDTEFIHDFLMQIMNGQRPNFECLFVRRTKGDEEEFRSQVLRDIDPSRLRQIQIIDDDDPDEYFESTYEIEVPSSKNITFTVDSNGYANLEKIRR